mmetsp:Transcript_31018/g.101136  ORF Transcript_31018/g.101136 Transcript_31018/m.101136 type:complete len:369 (+) Transcript_31018:174-1280(+)
MTRRVANASSISCAFSSSALERFLAICLRCAAWSLRLRLKVSCISCCASTLSSSLRTFHSCTISISSRFWRCLALARISSCCLRERSTARFSRRRASAASASRRSSAMRASCAWFWSRWSFCSRMSRRFFSMMLIMWSRSACLAAVLASARRLRSSTISCFCFANSAILRSCSFSLSFSISRNLVSASFACIVSRLAWCARARRASSFAWSNRTSSSAFSASTCPSRMFSALPFRIFCRSSSSCTSCASRSASARARRSSSLRCSAASATSSASFCFLTNSASWRRFVSDRNFLYATCSSRSFSTSLSSSALWKPFTLSVSSYSILFARSICSCLCSALIAASILSTSLRASSSTSKRSIRSRSLRAL